MSRSISSVVILAVACLASAACHHAAPAPAPASPVANADDARLARARADSIARADAARRQAAALAAARADSARRAADALRTAEANAREQLLAAIHFDFDKADIPAGEHTALDRKAALLTTNQAVRIRIDGNTDERGSDEYNLALGMRRAVAARKYLTERGVASSRIDVASNGEERPVCQDHDEGCWSRNRRDEFVIISGGERIVATR